MKKDNNFEKQNAKAAGKTAKGAVDAAKVATKAAAGNYAGAIKDFLKNPGGILTVIFVPLIALLLAVIFILNSFFGAIWGILTDNVPKSVADQYIEFEQGIIRNSFVKAYDSASQKTLELICSKVKAEDLGEFSKSAAELIFKDPDMLQEWLGRGYQQSVKFSEMGNRYGGYEQVINGLSNVFAMAENKSNGFPLVYNNDNAAFSSWDKITNIFDFNNVEFKNGKPVYNNKPGFLEKDKVQYRFVYHNKKFEDNAPSVAMFKTIFDIKYDYTKMYELKKSTEYINMKKAIDVIKTEVNKLNGYDKLTDKEKEEQVDKLCYEKRFDSLSRKSASLISSQLTIVMNNYNKIVVNQDSYYVDEDMKKDVNHYLSLLKKDKYVQNTIMNENSDLKSQIEKLPEAIDNDGIEKEMVKDENGKEVEKNKVSDAVKNMQNKIEKDKREQFEKFMTSENVYSQLLVPNVNVSVDNDINTNFSLPSYENIKIGENSADVAISNIKKVVLIDIVIDLCDYKKLGEIYGFYSIDEKTGEKVMDEFQKGLYNYAMNNASNKNGSSSNENVVKNPNEGQYAGVNNNKMFWPLKDVLKNKSKDGDKIYVLHRFGESYKTSFAGTRVCNGISIVAPYQTPVSAIVPGVVVESEYTNNGSYIVIESTVPINGKDEKFKIKYNYLDDNYVFVGQNIDREHNIIGTVGNNNLEDRHMLLVEMMVNDNPTDIEKYLPDLDGDGFKYFGTNKTATFNYTLESLFHECQDAGKTTAEVLTDAGYLKSSIFWQYKQICYNVIFCQAVNDYSKLPFFVDAENIARNPDGSLKIEKFHSATYESDNTDGFWGAVESVGKDIISGIEDLFHSIFGGGSKFDTNFSDIGNMNAQALRKTYYVVYCKPGTIVTLPFAAYRSDFDGTVYDFSESKDWWYGNNGDSGACNYIISQLPAARQPKITEKMVQNMNHERMKSLGLLYEKNGRWSINTERIIALNKESKEIWDEEKKRELSTVKYYNKTDYNKDTPFSFASYCFRNNSFVFDVANLQVSYPNLAGKEIYYTGMDYKQNNGYIFSHYSGMNGVEYLTAPEARLDGNKEESAYQFNATNDKPVILGNTLIPDLYPKDKKYDPNNTETYPSFVVSTCLVPYVAGAHLDTVAVDIEDVFDLDVVGDLGFKDEATGYTWPLLNSYEHINNVKPVVDLGTVEEVNADDLYIVFKKNNEYIKVLNVLANETVNKGTEVKAGADYIGSVPDGLMPVLQYGYYKDGKFVFKEQLFINGILELSTDISTRSDTSLGEDSIGLYQTVLALSNGFIVKCNRADGNESAGNITVYSPENNLFYEYNNIKLSNKVYGRYQSANGMLVPVSDGERIGIIHTFNEEELNHLNVKVYGVDKDSEYYIPKEDMSSPNLEKCKNIPEDAREYYNLGSFFPNLNKAQTTSKRIFIKTEKYDATNKNHVNIKANETTTLSGRLLYKGDSTDLFAWVFPTNVLTNEQKEVDWRVDNDCVSIVKSGDKCTVTANHAGIATITCFFKNKDEDGLDGIAAQCIIEVPEQVGAFYIKYKQTHEKEFTDYANKIVKVVLNDGKDKSVILDIMAEIANKEAFQGAEWKLVDSAGNEVPTAVAEIIKNGTETNAKSAMVKIKCKQPHKAGEYMVLRIKSLAQSGETNKDKTISELKIQIVQPITEVKITDKGQEGINLITEKNEVKDYVDLIEGIHFDVMPKNATYDKTDFSLSNLTDGYEYKVLTKNNKVVFRISLNEAAKEKKYAPSTKVDICFSVYDYNSHKFVQSHTNVGIPVRAMPIIKKFELVSKKEAISQPNPQMFFNALPANSSKSYGDGHSDKTKYTDWGNYMPTTKGREKDKCVYPESVWDYFNIRSLDEDSKGLIFDPKEMEFNFHFIHHYEGNEKEKLYDSTNPKLEFWKSECDEERSIPVKILIDYGSEKSESVTLTVNFRMFFSIGYSGVGFNNQTVELNSETHSGNKHTYNQWYNNEHLSKDNYVKASLYLTNFEANPGAPKNKYAISIVPVTSGVAVSDGVIDNEYFRKNPNVNVVFVKKTDTANGMPTFEMYIRKTNDMVTSPVQFTFKVECEDELIQNDGKSTRRVYQETTFTINFQKA